MAVTFKTFDGTSRYALGVSSEGFIMTKLIITLLLGGWLFLIPLAHADVPDFSGTDLEGKVHHLADYKGKMLVINYWATWCPPCREEIPELSMFYEAHKGKDAMVLGVNFEEVNETKLRAFIDEQMIDYPVIQTRPRSRSAFGLMIGLPTTYIISADQKSMKAHVGPVTKAQLEQYLKLFSASGS